MSFQKRIYYRIFPTEKLDFNYIKLDRKCNKIFLRHLQDISKNSMKKTSSFWEFETDGVFFNASQERVYNDVKSDLLEKVIKGHNGVIVAFGQTGCGKTFTLTGLHLSEQEFGLVPRLIKDLLICKKEQPKNIKMCIQLSYLEFNKSSVVDLLQEPPSTLEMYKSHDAKKVTISSEYDALKCLYLGEGRKNFVEKKTSYLSNLSTSVLTFHVTTKDMDLSNPIKIRSRLHIVDLAGNESCTASKMFKDPKEIGFANVMKSQMEQFVLCLTENVPKHIRVRQRTNGLLFYLDGDFSNNSILRFIGHIKPKAEDLIITISMLRFGYTIRGLKMKTKQIQFEMNEEIELQYLRKKLKEYEKDQHLNSVLLNNDLVGGLNMERINHLNNLIQSYLKDEVHEITVLNVADAQLVLRNLKEQCNVCQDELKKTQNENQILMAQQSETSLKYRGSKTNSQGSGSKISRRSSRVKSKESLLKDKKTSASNISEKRIKTTGSDVAAPGAVSPEIPLLVIPKRRKSKSSAGGTKQSSHGRRKTSNTSIIDKHDSKCSVKSGPEITIPIPDIIPEKQDVWKQFSSGVFYKERVEEYKHNEKDVRNSFMTYIKQIKKLQYCKDSVEKCVNDLLVAQTYRKFNSKDEYDKNGVLILTYAEKLCKESLDEAQMGLLEEQEKTLVTQEELKAYLENRRSIIKRINEEFDEYSRDNYKIPSTDVLIVDQDLKPFTFEADLEEPENVLDRFEELTTIPAAPEKQEMMKKLQKLMSIEMEKHSRILCEKKHKWKNV